MCVNIREDPPSRLAKMGAMPTPFAMPARVSDRVMEDTPPLPAERKESRPETPPGNYNAFKQMNTIDTNFITFTCYYITSIG